MAAPPQQTLDRLAENLAKAAAARAARVELTDRVAAGATSLATVLHSPDEAAQHLKVVALLESVPGVGKVAARRAMAEIGILDTCRVGDLGAGDRRSLLDRFGGAQ
jgi:hypothetical protein